MHQGNAQPVSAADDVDTDRLLNTTSRLCHQVTAQQAHERRNFGVRPAPIVGREGVQSERPYAGAGSGLDDFIDGLRAFEMTCRAGQAAALSPATVSIHDDGDVEVVHWQVLCFTE